ncbi:uncharacterized protein LOC111716480 [Eurytemora carolleeae]|uniref:uncharacterized protein LOC111716480 n=1 Tax=Eurytemora carolleeae TaxID=1294199 RepID=UPI000C79499C|nr:uncharacterized protein LOC111716480 [Eurytemora carolleeae]|eukprot:XP_023347703.1 uncharacterized protein LOC111716480 [Eurytemora affinis]
MRRSVLVSRYSNLSKYTGNHSTPGTRDCIKVGDEEKETTSPEMVYWTTGLYFTLLIGIFSASVNSHLTALEEVEDEKEDEMVRCLTDGENCYSMTSLFRPFTHLYMNKLIEMMARAEEEEENGSIPSYRIKRYSALPSMRMKKELVALPTVRMKRSAADPNFNVYRSLLRKFSAMKRGGNNDDFTLESYRNLLRKYAGKFKKSQEEEDEERREDKRSGYIRATRSFGQLRVGKRDSETAEQT